MTTAGFFRIATSLRNRHLLVLDTVLFIASPLIAYALRFEGFAFEAFQWRNIAVYTAVGFAIKLGTFYGLGLYRGLWRYASVGELERIFAAGGTAGVSCVVAGAAVLPAIGLTTNRIPLSVLALEFIATFAIAATPRLAIRFASARGRRDRGNRRRAVVAGAGIAGQAVLREAETSEHADFDVVAFVDDDPSKRGYMLGGVSVAGGIVDIPKIVKQNAAHDVIIAIPAASGTLVRTIVDLASQGGAKTRIVPTLRDILSGNVAVTKLREVEIEDLLRREPVRTDMHAVRALATGKCVLVTGAGGSIGSEICRQIAELAPSCLVLFDHGENAMFYIAGELRRKFPALKVVAIIADIRNTERVRDAFERYKPFAVFHAAAHKHVPLMEENVHAAVNNNVIGTRNVVDAALDTDVEHFVCISTDKAVRPTSVMGATKRLGEQIVHRAAVTEQRNFVNVRFGNVLGSNGSVITIFLDQIRKGGPVTVTHPDMRRYFMTIPEAVQLVLQAAALGKGGELFVLDMGEPVRVADLARDLIRLSGLEEDDIEIVYTGVRPGEKLTEELFFAGEQVTGTEHPKILCARPDPVDAMTVERLDLLINSVLGTAEDKVLRELLHVLVPDFSRTDARNTPVSVPAVPPRPSPPQPAGSITA